MPPRAVAIRQAHPRLRLDRRAVARVIHTLDAQFRYTPTDRPHLTPAARQTAKTQFAATATQVLPTASLVTGHWSFPPAVPAGELSLVFLTDPALAQVHADFLDDPSTTDVITFEGDPALGSAGEICVSVDTAARFAKKHRRDFAEELTLYLVHGWLHLAGYDDLRPDKKRRMRAAEARALALLRAAGALPEFSLKPARA